MREHSGAEDGREESQRGRERPHCDVGGRESETRVAAVLTVSTLISSSTAYSLFIPGR